MLQLKAIRSKCHIQLCSINYIQSVTLKTTSQMQSKKYSIIGSQYCASDVGHALTKVTSPLPATLHELVMKIFSAWIILLLSWAASIITAYILSKNDTAAFTMLKLKCWMLNTSSRHAEIWCIMIKRCYGGVQAWKSALTLIAVL